MLKILSHFFVSIFWHQNKCLIYICQLKQKFYFFSNLTIFFLNQYTFKLMIFSPNIYLPIYLCIDIYLFMIYISLSLYISIYLYTSLYTYMSSKFPHYGSKSPGSCWGVSFPLYIFLLLCLCVACLQKNAHSTAHTTKVLRWGVVTKGILEFYCP